MRNGAYRRASRESQESAPPPRASCRGEPSEQPESSLTRAPLQKIPTFGWATPVRARCEGARDPLARQPGGQGDYNNSLWAGGGNAAALRGQQGGLHWGLTRYPQPVAGGGAAQHRSERQEPRGQPLFPLPFCDPTIGSVVTCRSKPELREPDQLNY